MRMLALLLLLHASLCQGASHDSDLAHVLSKYADGRAKIISFQAEWEVTYFDGDGKSQGNEFGMNQIVGGSEFGRFFSGSVRQDYIWNNGELWWMVGYDEDAIKRDPVAVESIRAQIYSTDLPIKRTFQGRSLLAFKLFAAEPDHDLRAFIDLSTSDPTLDKDGLLYVISMTHPGVLQSSGIRTNRENLVRVWLDPDKGFSAVRQIAHLREKPEDDEIILDTRVKRFSQHRENVWLPIEIETRIGNFRQQMQVQYSHVNQLGSLDNNLFPPATLVRKYDQYGDEVASAYFVVDMSGDLSEPILDEVEASRIRYQLLGEVRSHGAASSPWKPLALLLIGMAVLVAFFIARKNRQAKMKL